MPRLRVERALYSAWEGLGDAVIERLREIKTLIPAAKAQHHIDQVSSFMIVVVIIIIIIIIICCTRICFFCYDCILYFLLYLLFIYCNFLFLLFLSYVLD
jgi:hypothetical protein